MPSRQAQFGVDLHSRARATNGGSSARASAGSSAGSVLSSRQSCAAFNRSAAVEVGEHLYRVAQLNW